jgi:small subunit ribosomal protein S17
MMNPATQSSAKRRHLQGLVISTKMAKTIVVRVDRRVAHPKYGKYYTVSKKFKVHDEKGAAHVGDVIEIEETRPLSKEKRWRYIATVKPTTA